ncbi:Cordon-bleu protein-like 1 [Saguinus oedipus]|uniref:Cordon-bleu protein-like 1 n=1 Tax=Saguinus oedipus TaxID=9490 RepID=A0ABQ9VII1_SAGOE|nr:Cordon-bleu protein-like 1 [Saguinus oedipus]
MPASQSVPQDLAHIQERPASCIVKSMSVDETDKCISQTKEACSEMQECEDYGMPGHEQEIKIEIKHGELGVIRIVHLAHLVGLPLEIMNIQQQSIFSSGYGHDASFYLGYYIVDGNTTPYCNTKVDTIAWVLHYQKQVENLMFDEDMLRLIITETDSNRALTNTVSREYNLKSSNSQIDTVIEKFISWLLYHGKDHPCEEGRVRAGSLQLSSTSAGNSSLRRTKRKAPSPPSKISLHQSDENSHVSALQPEDGIPSDSVSEANSPAELSSPDSTSLAETSFGPGLSSQEQCTASKLMEETSVFECPGTPEAAITSLTLIANSGISSDYSLEEIDEKEELSEVPKVEAENICVKSQDIPFVSTDIINTLKNDPDSALGNDGGEFSQNSKKEKQETRSTNGQIDSGFPGLPIIGNNHEMLRRNSELDNVQNEIIVFPKNTEDNMKNEVKKTEINVGGVAKNNDIDMEVERPSNSQAHETVTSISYKENHLAASSVPDQKLNQPSAEKTKMQDVAIQTTPSCNSFDGKPQDHIFSDSKVEESVQTSNNISTQHSSLSSQDSVDNSREFRSQGTLTIHSEDPFTIKDPICAHGNDDLLPSIDRIDKNSTASYLKNYPLYRQDYNPKPKPSNEITREYIPKIGMTTYKIVPPKSLEIQKDWQSETIGYKDDQDIHTLGKKHTHENVKETAIQTEDSAISEGPKGPLPDLKPKPNLRTEHQVHGSVSSPVSAMVSPLKPSPKMTRDTGTAPFAPNLEDINNILESKFKSRASNPQAKPSSFFLQMQKRVSGHYVTSAAAKSVHAAPNPAPRELTNKEAEKNMLPSPEQTLSPLSKTAHSVPQPLVEKTDDDIIGQKPDEASPPPVAPKPVTIPASQVSAQNLKTLKTFGAPRPYSSSGPSPFALAVVKRSQSFSKESTESSSVGASVRPPANTEEGKTHSVNKFVDIPQLGVTDKENNSVHNEQNSQIPTPTDRSSFTLMRQSSLPFQSSDPEQMRQSLLTAIRSGEAAAKLKRKVGSVVNIGQVIMSICTKLQNKEHVMEALSRAKFKFPGSQKIHISKKRGFTKFNADKFEDMVAEKRLIPNGCGVKYIPNCDPALMKASTVLPPPNTRQ